MTPLHLNGIEQHCFNNKKHVKQVAVCKKVKCWKVLPSIEIRQIFVY